MFWTIVIIFILACAACFWSVTLIGNTPQPVLPPEPTPIVWTAPAPTDFVAPEPTAVAPVQTAVPEYTAPTVSGTGYDVYQGTDSCVDGTSLDNVYADISRIPLGNKEGASVYEISLTGNGTGGFDRFILIEERMTSQTMGFVKDSRTVHGLRYCGVLQDIMNYAPTHVDAMVQSAQDDQGQRPDPREIPIVLLKNDGTFLVVRDAPLWPGFLQAIKSHVLMTVN